MDCAQDTAEIRARSAGLGDMAIIDSNPLPEAEKQVDRNRGRLAQGSIGQVAREAWPTARG